MRHNQRPPLHASRLPVHQLSYLPNGSRLVACPDCGRWRGVVRSMLTPHAPDIDSPGRCPGSAQRINFDLDYAEWAKRMYQAEVQAGQRRNPDGKPKHSNPFEGVNEPSLHDDINPNLESLPPRM